MTDKITPLFPWEMMQCAFDSIGAVKLQKILSVGYVQIRRYCSNPQYTEKSSRGPIENLRIILNAMVEAGAESEAQTIVDYLAEAIGMDLRHKSTVTPDKDTLEAECLDDFPSLVKLHELMRDGAPLNAIKEAERDVHAEVEESVAFVVKQHEGDKNGLRTLQKRTA